MTIAAVAIVEASAPGKLFLLGEYAVLDGAPALLAAVDRRVTVTIAPSDDDRWHLSTPGLDLDLDVLTLEADGSIPAGVDERTRRRLRVFDAVRTVVRCSGALSIAINSTAFSAAGYKLGLGSSAAVATALTAALSTAAGRSPSREDIRILATDAHRSAQRGAGSGGDVASSSYGGLVGYVRDTAPTSLAWPQELEIMAVVTGTGSSTTNLVGKVTDYAARDPARYNADIARLAALAHQARDALCSADDFLRLASDYFEQLVELDAHAGAGIVSEHHLRLHSLAAGLDGVFKTSGAGGGDVGLVFGRRGASAARLAAAFAGAGAKPVPLGFGADGVTITPSTATAKVTHRTRDGSTS
jgi:phosphomevalonate kinase